MRTAPVVRVLVVGLLAGLLAGATGLAGQEPPATDASGAPAPRRPISRAEAWTQDRAATLEPAALQRRLSEQWRVIPLRDGVLLVPRRPGRAFKGIEVRQGSIAIDGQAVTGEEVRARLGADAELVLAASYLDPATLLEPAAPAGRTTTPSTEANRNVPVVPPADVTAPPHHRSARISLGRDLVIAEGERVDDAAVAILGSVTVNGEVNGDVVAVLGDVRVGPRASVRGNLTAVGGSVTTDPAARLYGGSNEVAIRVPPVSVHMPDFMVGPGGWRPPERWFAGMSLAWTALRLSLVAVFALALAAIARRPIDRMRLQLRQAPLATTLVGVAAQLLLLPAVIAAALFLLVSIVGIPLLALLPFALFALGLAWVAGFAAVAESLGERLGSRGSTFLSLLIGLFVIWAVTLVARGAALSVGGAFATVLAAAGLAIEFVAWSAALGAVILGWRRQRAALAPDYEAVPPVPSAPAPW